MSLSSGEAEFYGVVRASGAALGQQSLFADLGTSLSVRVWTDSSAAVGICSRQGLGKLRHVDTQTLWAQEKVRIKQIILKKVRGEVNPADLLIKLLGSRDKIDQLVQLFGCVFMSGRAQAAPLLRKRKLEVEGGDHGDMEIHVLDGVDEDGSVLVPEAILHDLDIWPHMYSEELQASMFPTAIPVPERETVDPEALAEHARLHRRWAATRISFTRR